MEEKIYKISVSNFLLKEKGDVAIVRGTLKELENLCNDMNKVHRTKLEGDLNETYSFSELPIQVFDENGEYFNVIPTRFSTGVSIDEPDFEVVKDTKKALEEKINAINEHSKEVYYEYENANILTPKQAWAKYEDRMKEIHVDVSKNSELSENVEREK